VRVEDILPIKTFEQLIGEVVARLRQAGFRITNLRPGGVFYTLLEVTGQGLADLYNLLKQVASQMYLDTAVGDWLDLKVAEFGVARKPAVKARGNVTFYRAGASGNVVIPAGTVVATPVDRTGKRLQFVVTADTVLQEGSGQVEVPVEAELAGAAYNVGPGTINQLVTHIAGVTVSNGENWLTREGADTEDDDSLRKRAKMVWTTAATGGTKAAYIAWGLEVPGVVVVRVNDQHPRGQGTVDVIITGTAGIPSADLVAQVQAYIDERRPLCADVLVMGPEPVAVDFNVVLYVARDYGDTSGIAAQAAEVIDIMFRYGDRDHPEIRKASPDYGVSRAQVISNLMTIPDVVNVELIAPAEDVPVNTYQLAVKGAVDIAVVSL
jgi:uncharacterized phage protein gp47/JayE